MSIDLEEGVKDALGSAVTFACNGIYYGYPTCCIKALMYSVLSVKMGRGLPPRPYEHPLLGTGYVPCHDCATTKHPDELVAFIGNHRRAVMPFPEQCEDDRVIVRGMIDNGWMEVLNERDLMPYFEELVKQVGDWLNGDDTP